MATNDTFANLIAHLEEMRPFIPMYIHLIISALFPIYTGAHASLSRPSSAAKPDKKTKKEQEDEEDEEEEKVQQMEGMSNKDAIVLPVTAGIVLMGLYFLIKWYGADLINLILGWYFAAVGVFSVAKLANDAGTFCISFVFPNWYADHGRLWRVLQSEEKVVPYRDEEGEQSESRATPLPGFLSRLYGAGFLANQDWAARGAMKQKYSVKAYLATILDFRANVNLINNFSALFGLGAIIYANTVDKPWFLTNLQGFAVSYSALQLMSPTTFNTGSLILAALFCYDIWAVFFTPFMVGVAKNLDQPIKLVFPRPDEPGATPDASPTKSYSMLGLGDIVLPGIMIGLALRFDLYMFYLRKQKSITRENGREVEKVPYVSVTGKWGDKFWTRGLPSSSLPEQLKASFPKRYFTASMVGYVIGMLTTLVVMSVFKHAQPALLYLVPGVLVSVWGTALVRGEVKEMWHFSEAVTGEQLDEEDKKAEDGEKTEGDEDKGPAQPPKGLFERLWQEIWGGGDQPAASKSDKEQATDAKVEVKDPAELESVCSNCDDGLLFHFSVRRFGATRFAKFQDASQSGSAAQGDHSRSGSEASDDPVVVSSTDVDASGRASTGAARHRNRSQQAADDSPFTAPVMRFPPPPRHDGTNGSYRAFV